jgi:hypothetical protein
VEKNAPVIPVRGLEIVSDLEVKSSAISMNRKGLFCVKLTMVGGGIMEIQLKEFMEEEEKRGERE